MKLTPTKMETPCREYQGDRHPRGGYGRKGKRILTRWIWEQVNGPIPAGMMVLHKCDNPPCFRYDHLFLGTQADNVRDMKAKGRARGPRGEQQGRSKLTTAVVVEIRNLHESGATNAVLARRFKVDSSNISLIVNRKTWTDV